MSRRWIIICVATVIVGAGGIIAWHVRARSNDWMTDAQTIRTPADLATVRDVMWRPPNPLELVNTARDERDPDLATAGDELVFVRGRAGDDADLWTTRRSGDGWSTPEPLTSVNTEADELAPHQSGDWLYFASNRVGGHGRYDIWRAPRTADGWGESENLGATINTRYDEHGPALLPDGVTVLFVSNRPGSDDPPPPPDDAWSSTVADYVRDLDDDLYAAPSSRTPGSRTPAQDTAQPLENLNSPSDEASPVMSPAGDFLYFASNRGPTTGFDLYRSRMLRGALLAPRRLSDDVNTEANELDPSIGLGGFGLHFVSDRSGEGYDVFFTVSREVFRESEAYRARLDLLSIWNLLWPYMLALAILAAILYGLRRAMAGRELGTVSLIIRCMMASLIAHMFLLVVMAFWSVSNAPGIWQRPDTGLQVALFTPAVSNGLAAQVRGQLTSVDVAMPMEPVERSAVVESPLQPRRVVTRTSAARVRLIQMDRPAFETPSREAVPSRRDGPAPTDRTLGTGAPINPQVPEPAAPIAGEETTAAALLRAGVETGRTETPSDFDHVSSIQVDNTAPEISPEALVVRTADATLADPRIREAPSHATSVPERNDAAEASGLAELPALTLAALPRVERTTATNRASEPTLILTTAHTDKVDRVELPDFGGGREAAVTLAPGIASPPTDSSLVDVHVSDANAGADAPTPAPTETPPFDLPDLALPAMSEFHRTGFGELNDDASRRIAVATAPAATIVIETSSREPVGDPLAPVALTLAEEIRRPGAISMDDAAVEIPSGAATTPIVIAPLPALELPPLGEARSREDAESADADRRPAAAAASRAAYDSPVSNGAMPLADATASDPGGPLLFEAEPRVELPDAPAARVGMPDALAALDPGLVALEMLPLDVSRPTRSTPNPYPQRTETNRKLILEEMGGNEETEEAVARSLDWLARHQSADGRWDGSDFDSRCGSCPGPQQHDADIALTGLSVLCFLAVDHTPDRDGPYREVVTKGLDYLIREQRAGGDILGRESLYSHGIATIALAEAYGMTGADKYERPVRKAVQFILRSANPTEGGWRYVPRQVGDTSVTGWQVMALAAARRAKIDVPEEAFDVARDWMARVGRNSRPGLYAYQPSREPSPAMTAEGLFIQQLLGADREETAAEASARYILRFLPMRRQRQASNTYFWYYGTLALFQHQGDAWRQWNEAIKTNLLDHQETEGRAAGSWAPTRDDRWSMVGGRVYQTAICTLTLEVYYRYLPGFLDSVPVAATRSTGTPVDRRAGERSR